MNVDSEADMLAKNITLTPPLRDELAAMSIATGESWESLLAEALSEIRSIRDIALDGPPSEHASEPWISVGGVDPNSGQGQPSNAS